MPNEEIFKKDDLARELALVNHGACYIYEDEKVSRVVRHDVSLLLWGFACLETNLRALICL